MRFHKAGVSILYKELEELPHLSILRMIDMIKKVNAEEKKALDDMSRVNK